MLDVNDISANSPKNQKLALGSNPAATFPVLQATSTAGWKNFMDCKNRKGKKNDGFVYAPDGTFILKHEGKGTVYMNIWEQDIRAGLNVEMEDLENCSCREVKNTAKHIHYVACLQ